LARDIDQPVPILPVSGSGEPVKSPVESSAEKCRNGYSDHDSANSDHSSVDDRESNRIEVLELENEDLKQQIELLKMCLSQKDVLIQSQDEKNRKMESEMREGEKAMQQWISQLKKTIIRLEDEAKVKDSSIAAYQTQNSLLNEEILELNGRIKCDGMAQSINRKYSEASDTSLIESFAFELDEDTHHDPDDDTEFVLVNDSEAPDSETCTWEECIATIKNNRQLTSQVKLQLRQGIPPRFRPRVWRSLMNHQIVMKLGLYSTLAATRPSEDIVKQIALDLPRTKRWLINDYSNQFKEKLRRVLWAFANHNKEIGYCQGLNRIACLALEHLYEEDAFYFLRLVTETLLPANYYTGDMAGIRADGTLVSEILKDKAPKLYDHLINIDSNVDTVAAAATNWLLVIFIDPAVDINVTLRIWDAFLCEGNKVLVRWCLALYIHQEERLLKCRDQAQVMQILKHKIIDIKDFDAVQNLAYNRLNPFSKKYVESIRQRILRSQL